jgi:signal transduction histidine kinase
VQGISLQADGRSSPRADTGIAPRRYNGGVRRLWQRIWAANPFLVDGIIAGVLAVFSLGALFWHGEGTPPHTEVDAFAVLLVVVGAGALRWRRHDPDTVAVVVLVATQLFYLRGYAEGLQSPAAMIAVWTAATIGTRFTTASLACSGIPLVVLAWLFTDQPFGQHLGYAISVAGAAIIGHNIRLRRETRTQEARTATAEAERAVSDERLRIARELHDVVAHAMSIVAVQAGVAAHIIDDQPDEAKRMLENVRRTSHEALDEMRRLLGVLRGGDAALAPAPGLHDVDDLVDSMRSSGIPVSLAVTGTRVDVPGGVDLTAYRIVQEALTNVLKHAGPNVQVDVAIEYEPGTVRVEVLDDGRGAAVHADGGHGLLGMRERVSVFGGELVAGPKPGGGFRVSATLPYTP